MSENNSAIRVNFATGAIGFLTVIIAALTPIIIWVFGYADASDSTSRNAELVRLVQSMKIGEVPVAAWTLGAYFLYEGFLNGRRWIDGTAVALNSTKLLLHPTYLKQAIPIDAISRVKKSSLAFKIIPTINPSLVIEWRDNASGRTRIKKLRNVDLQSSEGEAFQQRLAALGKWVEEA